MRLAIIVALLALAAPLGGASPDGDRCRRVAVVDGDGAPVRGIEDLAYDPRRKRLYLSAHDRWAVKDAVAADRHPPDGGVHAVSLARLRGAGERVRATDMTAHLGGAFQPHGIGFVRDGGTARLAAVNHAWGHRDGAWRKRYRLAVFRPRAARLERRVMLDLPALCRANDVAAPTPRTFYVTRDHGACRGPRRWLEMALGLDRAAVLRVELTGERRVRRVAEGLAMANGVALGPDRERLAVAATRGERIRIYETGAVADGPVTTLKLPAGPDNLSWRGDGRILAAVHDSLLEMALALYRVLWRERTGSHIVAVDPRTGATRTVVRDPTGRRLNAATAAVRAGPTVVAAGILDHALLVCRAGRA